MKQGYTHLLTPILNKYVKGNYHEDAVGEYGEFYIDDIISIMIDYEFALAKERKEKLEDSPHD
jgi:hypothetical protein